jgi:hypothetical protein
LYVKRALAILFLSSVFISSCGRQQTNNMDPATVPLQRSVHLNPAEPPTSQGLSPEVSHDWNVSEKIAGEKTPTEGWKKEIKDAGDRATKLEEGKVVPDHSYRSIWVHVFPILKNMKPYAQWPERMGVPDPYAATKDLGSIKLDSASGFSVAKLKDGTVIKFGQTLTFNLAKNLFLLDGKSYPFENLYVDANSTNITAVTWDHNKIPYKYRGGFVVTKEETPSGTIGLRLVNVVDFEAYLMDVVPGEMPSNYGEEPLKVQAVAARTYALNKMLAARCEYVNKTCRRKKPRPYDVFANTQDQLYMGIAKEDPRTKMAVAATSG